MGHAYLEKDTVAAATKVTAAARSGSVPPPADCGRSRCVRCGPRSRRQGARLSGSSRARSPRRRRRSGRPSRCPSGRPRPRAGPRRTGATRPRRARSWRRGRSTAPRSPTRSNQPRTARRLSCSKARRSSPATSAMIVRGVVTTSAKARKWAVARFTRCTRTSRRRRSTHVATRT